MIQFLFHDDALYDSHPTDKSVDSLETGHQVRTWFSGHAVFAFLHGTCGNTWSLSEMGNNGKEGK
ncbi:MAG: hypothetical protein KGI02_04900 [Thaumarchaeota archaeon]|nr:hypothetical protein [Nitrososphaerota archaeon]MDE1840370.1 hypothetical protein [Nitrososphaerota archaeon]MDE1878042.1 hypothetical protein [Nitrososphaerota archaeon]